MKLPATMQFEIPRHLWVAATAWISRLIQAFVLLLSIRLLTDALGAEAYAAYCVLAGLTTWFYLMDLGMAASLQNFVSELRATGRPYHDFVVTSACSLVASSTLLGGLLLIWSDSLSSWLLRNFTTLDGPTKQQAFMFAVAALTITVVGNVAYRIWYAEDKGYVANLLAALGTLAFAIAMVGLVHRRDFPPLLHVVAAYFGPPACLACLSLLLIVCRSWRAGGRFQFPVLNDLLRRAVGFWLFALLAAAVLGVDYLVLSQRLQAEDVVIYSIAMKSMMFGLSIYTALLTAFWPTLTALAASRSWRKIASAIKLHIHCGLAGAALFVTLLAAFKPDVMRLLAPTQAASISTSLVALAGVYLIIRVWTDTFATFMLSINNTRPLMMFAAAQALLSGLLQYLLAKPLGAHGVLLGLIGSYLVTVGWGLPFAYRRLLHAKLSLCNA